MIVVDLQTFQQSREGGNVTGVIYLELESGAFPEFRWVDFPVIILSWWASALLQLDMAARRNVPWQFMDGPYSLTLTEVAEAVSGHTLPLEQLLSSLLKAAERVVVHCGEHRMFNKDLEILRENVMRLAARCREPHHRALVAIHPSHESGR